jgi:hypothetical protein
MRGIGRGTAKVIQHEHWIAGDDKQDQALAVSSENNDQ